MICFDTNILIWGVQGAGDGLLVNKAKNYIKFLDEKREQILVPCPAFQEYMRIFDGEDFEANSRIITKSFILGAFDPKAALIAAKLQNNKNVMADIRKNNEADRNKISVDAQILAIAISNNAECVISNDEHMLKLAQDEIKVYELPEILSQFDLPFRK